MTLAQAYEINALIVKAWMIREGIMEAEIPDLRKITLAAAVEAAQIVQGAGPTRHADGTQTLHCVVDPTTIPKVFAWAIVARQNRKVGR
jgi:hypothetical protein